MFEGSGVDPSYHPSETPQGDHVPADITNAFQITIDCGDPDRMARFWAPALGCRLQEPPAPHGTWREYWLSVGVPEDEAEDGYDSMVDPGSDGPRIWSQQVPEAKVVKNRLHFDLLVGGGWGVAPEERKRRVLAEGARLVGIGAIERHTMDQPGSNRFALAMADPEGNEFDIV